MLELKEEIEDEEDSDDSESNKKRKNSKKKKSQHDRSKKDHKGESDDDSDEDEQEDDEEDKRPASFFKGKEGTDQEEQDKQSEGLTEAEVNEAFIAIVDGLSRELRSEFEIASESSIAELEVVAVAAFIDSFREKLESGEQAITEELLDEALCEAIEDLLCIDENAVDEAELNEPAVETNDGNNAESIDGGSVAKSAISGGNGGANNYVNGISNAPNTPPVAASVAAFVASNKNTIDKNTVEKNNRGKGLLIGGVVGYIIGRRHGRKRAEATFQPEIDKLENQVAELYKAVAAREHLMRSVVQELAARQLGDQQAVSLAAKSYAMLTGSVADQHNVSKTIKPPSLVIPSVFAALLVYHRLSADIENEKNTWGKDFLVGGVAGYMVGRRHGRKRTETRLKSEIELLEDQVNNLQDDLVNKETVIAAMAQVVSASDQANSMTITSAKIEDIKMHAEHLEHEADQLTLNEMHFVDDRVNKIAIARKKREIKRHRELLLQSGRAISIGEFNLSSSVFLERRLIDGTENSTGRTPIETMNEGELLTMSQNMYVDGESAIDLYENGRLDIEVLRESVKQYWRKTGDYEQTLRTNLKTDDSTLNNIRTELEKTYRTIVEQSLS